MHISMMRTSRALSPGRQPVFAGLLLAAGLGTALIFGGCGAHTGQTTQNANNPGSSQTTGVQNGGPATGGPATGGSTSNGKGQGSGSSLQSLNNSINGSASSLNNDQNDANSSASQSQEQEQQP